LSVELAFVEREPTAVIERAARRESERPAVEL
jgi:hypothetical protein